MSSKHMLSGSSAAPHQKDGASPEATLILDAAGNLYSTTYGGGSGCSGYGCGIVFELTTWTPPRPWPPPPAAQGCDEGHRRP